MNITKQFSIQVTHFLGMYAPLQSIRIAAYRKAGAYIGKVHLFGNYVSLDTNFKNLIIIKDGVHLSGRITILSHDFLSPNSDEGGFSPVILEENVRVGINVTILPGVRIGKNSEIGAGAVVTKNIPSNCIAVGVPAKPIRYFTSNKDASGRMTRVPKLYVKCKTCGVEFWSAIRCELKIFKILNLQGNCHPCPKCGHKNYYGKKDYYYEKV
jgi:acetyltransferase-like isoleucine patch superfamily enzyme